jgi:hypothetical protein
LLEQARYGGGAGGAISAGTRWSESTEWWHALETSCSTPDLIAHTRSAAGASPHPDDLLEEDHWYWSAAAWESYVFPEPYALSDHEGEVVFAAEAGETVREAFAAVGKSSAASTSSSSVTRSSPWTRAASWTSGRRAGG